MEPLLLRDRDERDERDAPPESASQPILSSVANVAQVAHVTLPGARSSPPRIAARRKRALVFLEPGEVWAFEADARLTFVHSAHGRLDIDIPLAEIEASSLGSAFVRVHRSWLANLALVKALEHTPGETQLFVGAKIGERTGIRVPVSRDRVRPVRDVLLAGAIGVRRRESGA
jgi:DNA-binding LytR/AlgR family response regulator